MVMAADPQRQYTVPKTGGHAPAVLLALAMHVLLAVFLFYGLSWQSHAPEAVDAELWSSLPQISAPIQAAPPPVVQPPPPVVEPQPVQVVPPTEPPPQPEIAIRAPEPPKVPPKPVVQAPPPPPPREKKPELKPPPKAPSLTKPLPPSDLALLQEQAGKPSTGHDARTSGPGGSPGYAARIAGLIRSHTNFPPPAGISGNPTVTINLQLLPSGEVTGLEIVKSSGISAFDEAVQRGIRSASPFPKDTDGRVPPSMTIDYRMFDQSVP